VVRELQGDGRAILHPPRGSVQWDDWLDFKKIVLRTRIGDLVPIVLHTLKATEAKMMAMALRPVSDPDVRAAVQDAHRVATGMCATGGGGAEVIEPNKLSTRSRRMCVSAPVMGMSTVWVI